MLEIFLYVIIYNSSATNHIQRTRMPDMKACLESVQKSKALNSNGSEKETALVLFCGTKETERHFNSTWWKDPQKAL